jgi:hypothetical protein
MSSWPAGKMLESDFLIAETDQTISEVQVGINTDIPTVLINSWSFSLNAQVPYHH